MPIIRTGAGEYEHELAKFEQLPHDVIATDRVTGDRLRPGNPYTYRPYPRMLYKAHASPRSNGKMLCMEAMPVAVTYTDEKIYQRDCLAVEQFNVACQRIVGSADDERVAMNDGWREDPDAAMAYVKERIESVERAAAEVAYAAQGMTDKARRELAEADASTSEHVVDVQASKRGRRAVTAEG